MTEAERDRLWAAVLATPDGKLFLQDARDRHPGFDAEATVRIARARETWRTGAP